MRCRFDGASPGFPATWAAAGLGLAAFLASHGMAGCDRPVRDAADPEPSGRVVGDSGADAGSDADADAYGDEGPPSCNEAIAAREGELLGEIAGWSIADAARMTRTGGDQRLEADYAGRYRDDLATHPGCVPRESYDANGSEPFVRDNEASVPPGSPAAIPGYPCAAKEYDQSDEDETLPIVILVHGNSSGVASFEEYSRAGLAGAGVNPLDCGPFSADREARPQLATRLLRAGHRVIGFDARVDLVATLRDFNVDHETGNPFLNVDHGWVVPMLQALIRAVMNESPDRMVALVGHSLGATSIRDALRRLHLEHRAGEEGSVDPFEHLSDVVLLSGPSHGLPSGLDCVRFPHMRGTVACELGDRETGGGTYFTNPLNGPGDLFAAPCADGDYAFGQRDRCGGNVVEHTTLARTDGSEGSARLDLEPCVANLLITADDCDRSGYFMDGLYAGHFGTARSEAGIRAVLDVLAH